MVLAGILTTRLERVYLKVIPRIKWLRRDKIIITASRHQAHALLSSLIFRNLQYNNPFSMFNKFVERDIEMREGKHTLARRNWLLLCSSISCRTRICCQSVWLVCYSYLYYCKLNHLNLTYMLSTVKGIVYKITNSCQFATDDVLF